MPDSDWWDVEYDLMNPYTFPDYQDEMRYDPKLNEIKLAAVQCCACWKIIDSLETHVLKTLYFGWHMNAECLKDMENWVVDERQRRESKIWRF
jgi:hypothetical protein